MMIHKEHDYSALFTGLDQALHADFSQMELYCEIGKLICSRPEKGAAVAAATYLTEKYPDKTGFSARNMRRMRDFYRMYENAPELLAQAMRLNWTQNVVILESDLTMEERAWYLKAAKQFGWSKLTLQKKIAEAAHLTEVLDTASEMCYTEQDESTRISSVTNDTGEQWPLSFEGRYETEKRLEMVLPALQWYTKQKIAAARFHDPPPFRIVLRKSSRIYRGCL